MVTKKQWQLSLLIEYSICRWAILPGGGRWFDKQPGEKEVLGSSTLHPPNLPHPDLRTPLQALFLLDGKMVAILLSLTFNNNK